MKAFTIAKVFAALVVLPNVMGGTISIGKTETVLTPADTTLNLNALAARQLSIPSLTLCQNSNCNGPCYSYYLGEYGSYAYLRVADDNVDFRWSWEWRLLLCNRVKPIRIRVK